MKRDVIIVGLFLMLACSAIVDAFLRAFYHKKYKRALLFKGIASACFIAFGAYNFFSREFSWPTLAIFIGLCWGIVGDEIIALCQLYPQKDTQYFIGGGVFFVVGHVFYMIALLMLAKINFVAVAIVLLIGMLLSAIYGHRKKYLAPDIKSSLMLYLAIVIFFAAVGAGSFLVRGTLGTALFAIGGVLFTVSDNILFAFKYGHRPRYRQNVNLHIAYYLAQFDIAWSIALL